MKKSKFNVGALFILPVLIVFVCLWLIMGTEASANTGDINQLKNYESVLIKDGDTLTSIAAEHAECYSYYSNEKYMEAIMNLNNLESEHIKSGSYLLLPNFK